MEPSQQAKANFGLNRDAVAITQPWLADGLAEVSTTFVFGRDGALTALQADGLWLGACSVPREAAREQLKTLQLQSNVACFLDPRHGQHLLVAMEVLRSDHALIAVCPDASVLNLALHCVDLAEPLGRRRLFLCTGRDWPTQLRRILDENPGLPIPAAFVRTNLSSEDVLQELIQQAQKVFSDVSTRRSAELASLLDTPRQRTTPARILVIAPSRFRLWDDAGWRLGQILSSADPHVRLFDPDLPTSASPLALARALSQADAIITADTGRADLPAVAPATMPWITVLTRPRIPAPRPDAPADRLILCDPSWATQAVSAGWPASSISVAALPPRVNDPPGADAPLAIIADTQSTAGVAEKLDYSSHRLLWELVESDLAEDPLHAGRDPLAYLKPRMRKLEIAPEAFDFAQFIDRLLVPCYQQNLARHLACAEVRLAVWGDGWSDLPDVSAAARGLVRDHAQLRQALQSSAGLVHCWPIAGAHPADFGGRPVLRPEGTIRSFVQRLRGPLPKAAPPTTHLSVRLVQSLLA